MKRLLIGLIFVWAIVGAAFWYWNDARAQPLVYRTASVRLGDLHATVEATGTLEPEEIVDVCARIPGEVRSFGTDPADTSKTVGHGTLVEQGTVLARLDDALFKARAAQAKASVAKAKGELAQIEVKLAQAERDWERTRNLQARKRVVSEKDVETSLANFETEKANRQVAASAVEVAEANLEEATINLNQVTIVSPVKGVVLDRRVNLGQTVFNGASSPSLFLIARDLDRMEIWASVNESDVGAIRVGQAVSFTVSAHPRETFQGSVGQIRLNASMNQNVVTYTVVVKTNNAGGKLLPYMTARLRFHVDERKSVLILPSVALRWEPKLEQIVPDARAEFLSRTRAKDLPKWDKTRAAREAEARDRGVVWVRQGEYVRPILVRVGLTDGLEVEVSGDRLKEGDKVVVGAVRQELAEEVSSPFLPQIKNDKAKK